MMGPTGVWRLDLFRVVGIVLVLVGIGYVTGHTFASLLIAFLVYFSWTQWNLYRLYVWLEDREHNVLPTNGGVWGEAFNAIDKLERNNRRRKRKLGRMLNGFQRSMSALPDATVVLDKSLQAEWWNKTAEKFLGLKRKFHKLQSIEQVIQTPEFTRYLKIANYKEPLELASPVMPDVLLEIRIVPYGKGKKLLQARDITLVKHLEQVRQDFVSNASHELRTPLTVISGYLETMKEEPDIRNGPWYRMVSQMYGQVNRVIDIVADMLTLSRMDQYAHCDDGQIINIELLLYGAYEEAKILSGNRKHRIECDIEDGFLYKGCKEDMQSIVTNLLSNAIRYTPDEGFIGMRWWIDENGAHLYVADTGIGIAQHHLPRLTERFYRVDTARSRQSGSTGLGLAIVKHALIRQDGELEIKSDEGVGSTFTCHFPASRLLEKLEQDYPRAVMN